MNIGIIGSRGIPNRYGGYEQVAGYLSAGLVQRHHRVSVYNSHRHPYRENTWNGVNIIRCYDPESWMGTAGQFIYDLNCIRDARKRKFDILLFLGYTSSSLWGSIYPKKSIIITNMDGMEWMRSKYSKPVRKFLKYAEKLAVRSSKFHIADSIVIKDYLDKKYGINCRYIAYGSDKISDVFKTSDILFDAEPGYFMLMARMEKENNIDIILEGYQLTAPKEEIIVVGDNTNGYGKSLVRKYVNNENIKFKGAIFDGDIIRGLIAGSSLYFHGHSVGGTNPSLLEAMASNALIAAHDNPYNRAILGDDGIYFSTSSDVKRIISHPQDDRERMIKNNAHKISTLYTWDKIIDDYEQFFKECLLAG